MRPSILHPLSSFFGTVANWGLQAAQALEHAHELGVVHRDVKPANLLVDVRGNLWITDFGLAHCQSQAGLTMTGDLVGTLRYMSPEQALAKRFLVDHRTDIYSLGVTLYELLTLEHAFSGLDREELLRQIAFEEPRAPRQQNKAIPRELETIVLKAMEKTPEARYATAHELADDLRRFLEDRPIQAKRPTLVQRAAKWARRHKAVVRAAAVVLGLAAVASLFMWRAQQRTNAEQWMREWVLPNLQHHLDAKDYRAAFDLAELAEHVISGDPTLAKLRPEFTSTWSVITDPPDADVYAKAYDRPKEDWQYLGRSPLEQARLPRRFFRWSVRKEGFAPVEGFPDPVDGRIQFTLDRAGRHPAGMVRVAGNAYRKNLYGMNDLDALDLDDYLIDRCEVTNRQFKEFVDRGGYRERKYWKESFLEDKTVLSWEDARKTFRASPAMPHWAARPKRAPLREAAWAAPSATWMGRRRPSRAPPLPATRRWAPVPATALEARFAMASSTCFRLLVPASPSPCPSVASRTTWPRVAARPPTAATEGRSRTIPA